MWAEGKELASRGGPEDPWRHGATGGLAVSMNMKVNTLSFIEKGRVGLGKLEKGRKFGRAHSAPFTPPCHRRQNGYGEKGGHVWPWNGYEARREGLKYQL